MAKINPKLHLKIYIFIVVIMIICIAFLGSNLINKEILDSEVSKILNKNIITSKFDKKTKTHGSYKKVEYAIKSYMKDYSDNMKKANNIINDSKLKKVLSASNYEQDKPAWAIPTFRTATSAWAARSKKSEFDTVINNLLKMADKKVIMSYIKKENVSKKYINLYKKYMFSNNFENDLIKNKESITKIQTNGNNLLDIDAKVINLLKNNINTWVIKDNAIYFYSKSVMTEYNTLINSIS